MIYLASMSNSLINLSFYRFYPVGDSAALQALKNQLQTLCANWELKGTLLIASEGINGMLSGTRTAIDHFKTFAQENLGLHPDVFKETFVSDHSFTRTLIKIKKEIIPVGDPDLKPYEFTAPRISARELREWFDQKRPFILLDTRNRYEVEVGTFQGAQEWGLESSRDFAQKASENLEKLHGAPIVTFCTGGIRCEKASAVLLKLGAQEVYQLDGGILRYFEVNGSAHFEGNCFVFDWRLAVDGNLKPAPRSSDPKQSFGRHQQQN